MPFMSIFEKNALRVGLHSTGHSLFQLQPEYCCLVTQLCLTLATPWTITRLAPR